MGTYLDAKRIVLQRAVAIHSQELTLPEIVGLAVILIERSLTIFSYVYAKGQRPLGLLHCALR